MLSSKALETYIVSAIQPCLICSTLPVEFNRRDRSYFGWIVKVVVESFGAFLRIFTYIFSTKKNIMNHWSIQWIIVFCFFRILNIILCFRLKKVKNICFITYVPNNSKIKLLRKPTKQHAFSTHYNLHTCANSDHVESIFCHNQSLGLFFSFFLRWIFF